MNGKLELILLPVADVDRAKQFYVDTCGFELHVDHAPNERFRVVQCHPKGSACSIAFGNGMQIDTPPGSVRGLHVMVEDIVAAGVDVAPIVHSRIPTGTAGCYRNADSPVSARPISSFWICDVPS